MIKNDYIDYVTEENEEKLIDIHIKEGSNINWQFSYHEILFRYLQDTTKIDIGEKQREVADRLVNEHVNEYIANNVHKINGEQFLLELQMKIEEEMKKIISTKSIYYWIHLYRRIGVMGIYGENSTTLSLYRDILEIAIKKYGKVKLEDEFVQIKNESTLENLQQIGDGLYVEALNYYQIDISTMKFFGGLSLKHFSDKALLEIYVLEYLAYNYWWTTVCLRRLYKGGHFVLSLGFIPGLRWPFFVHAPEKLQRLMIVYDERVSKYGELASSNGIILNNYKEGNGYSVLCPVYNVERRNTEQFPLEKIFNCNIFSIEDEFVSNFLWYAIDLSYYYQNHEFSKEKFFEKNKYSLESFVCTIFLILYENYMETQRRKDRIKETIQRAYRYYNNYDVYKQKIWKTYQKVGDEIPFDINEKELESVLQGLMIPKDRKYISLSTRGPQYALFEAGNYLVVDYYAIINILEHKTHKTEQDKSTKGHDFEKIVKERLEKKGFFLWECAKKLKNKDGSSKEIDISFIYKGYLFIGELKCHNRPLNFDIGNRKYLERRQEKFERALNQVNEKAKWLKGYYNASNYTIPKEVHSVVPFVISPFVEYIWDMTEELWLTYEIPRICSVKECEHLCSEDVLKSIEKKSYIIKLNER